MTHIRRGSLWTRTATIVAVLAALVVAVPPVRQPPAGAMAAAAVVPDPPARHDGDLAFVPNVGQTDELVDYVAPAGDVTYFLTAGDAVIDLGDVDTAEALRVDFAGGSDTPAVADSGPATGPANNFFLGSDPTDWATGVRGASVVTYTDVYPGIDVRYRGEGPALVYDVVVHPGADPGVVAVGIEGASSVAVAEDGRLEVHTERGRTLWFAAPVTYQEIDGERIGVDSAYELGEDGLVRFAVGDHDPSHVLVIDPTVEVTTYLGGSANELGDAAGTDSSGNIIVAGRSGSSDFPTTVGAYDRTSNGNDDIVVTKLSADGTSVLWSTYVGGAGGDYPIELVVDASDRPVIVGYTGSSGFPTTAGAYDTTSNGGNDGIVFRLSSTGASLSFSTFLGGSSNDYLNDVALDASGAIVVGGYTTSSNYPTTAGVIDTVFSGGEDGVVTKLNSSGTSLTWSTFVGGGTQDRVHGVAIDSSGNVHAVARTDSSDVSLPNGYDTTFNGGQDAAYIKLNSTATSVSYATYLGGGATDIGYSISVVSPSEVYLTGETGGNGFPTTAGAFDTTHNGGVDTWVARLNPTLSGSSSLVWSTYLGGSGNDVANEAQVDANGYLVVAGSVGSSGLATPGAPDTGLSGTSDAFVASFTPSGSRAFFSYLGGSGTEAVWAVAIDPSDRVVVVGDTSSSNLATSPGAYDTSLGGSWDIMLARYSSMSSLSVVTVNSTDDDGDNNIGDGFCDTGQANSAGADECTLKAAVQEANASSLVDTIEFDIPTTDSRYTVSGTYWTIAPAAGYTLSTPMTVDATTQPSYAGAPDIYLDGTGAAGGSDAFAITGDDVTVRGFAIGSFPAAGIYLPSTSDGAVIESNYIGTDITGTLARPHAFEGIYVDGATNVTIGGAGVGNLLSGNASSAVGVNGGSGITISGNLVGTRADGQAALANGWNAIEISSATNVGIGGANVGEGNVIAGNSGIGVRLSSVTTASIQGNTIGLAADGTTARANSGDGIRLVGGSGITVGGTTIGARNVVSANSGDGIQTTATAVTIQGNRIGTDVTGLLDRGNTAHGVYVTGGSGVAVGGGAAGAGNVISGNSGDGVQFNVNAAVTSTVRGNLIGVGVDGTTALANTRGVAVFDSRQVVVGGVSAGEGNTIRSNLSRGIITSGAADDLAILANTIVGNLDIGIDHGIDGRTLNDTGDVDTGPNGRLNFPEVTAATESGGTVTVDVDLDVPAGNYRLEAFVNPSGADPTGYGEGETFAAATTITHGGTGAEPFQITYAGSVGDVITLTATEDLGLGVYGATSEFSAAYTLAVSPNVVVNSTGDGVDANAGDGVCSTSTPGECTLRAAIQEANAHASIDTIEFAIPGGGPTWTIAAGSALPTVSAGTTIDATTQPGWSSTPVVILDGVGSGGADGLTVNGADSVVRGLAVGRFGRGIYVGGARTVIEDNHIGTNAAGTSAAPNTSQGLVVAAADVVVQGNVVSGNGADGVVVEAAGNRARFVENHIGVDVTGNVALGNGQEGIELNEADDVVIGEPGLGNVISGNDFAGINGWTGSPNNVVVQANHIGVGADGVTSIGNGSANGEGGVVLRTSANDWLVGGTGVGEGNLIVGNTGAGVQFDTVNGTADDIAVLGNSLVANSGLAIDLLADGVTANDVGDGDVGPNGLLNFPVIAAATEVAGTVTVQFDLDVPAGSYRIEAFRNPSGADGSGHGEGEVFVGAVTVAHSGSGVESFQLDYPGASGDVVALTATEDLGSGSYGSTSEVSASATVVVSDPVVLDRIQKGVTTIAGGATTSTVSIDAVDTSTSFLLFTVRGNDANPQNIVVGGRMIDGSTLEFGRQSTVGTVTIEWSVLTFSSGVTVQRGVTTMTSSTQTDTTISSVDLSRSFPLVGWRAGGTGFDAGDFVGARLTSSTNLRVTANAATSRDVYWQVVTYNDAQVQSGVTNLGTAASSATATVGSVDTAASWLTYTVTTDTGTGANIGQKLVRGRVTNATTLTFDRSSTGQAMQVQWYLIEFTDGAAVQSGSRNFGTGTTTSDITVSAVEPARSVATGGYLAYGGRSAYTADDNPGVGWFTTHLTTATNVRATRDVTGSATADLGWFVITWPGAGPDTVVVNSTGDGGDRFAGDGYCDTGADPSGPQCTLRAAIEEANAHASIDTIEFAIPGAGPTWTISPATVLPDLSTTVTLDATTQPGYTTAPVIRLDGASVGAGDLDGLVITGNDVVVRGLSVTTFPGDGIMVLGDRAAISDNHVGVLPDGVTPGGNGTEGIIVTGDDVVIDGNTIGDHPNAAITHNGTATGLTVSGNVIGADASGSVDLGNGQALWSDSTGTALFTGNTVANSQYSAIEVHTAGAQVSVVGNTFVDSGGLAIDLVGGTEDGFDVTANDAGDADSGPNDLLNHPVVTAAVENAGTVTVDFDLDVPAGSYRIEAYTNPSGADASGHGELEVFETATVVSHTGSGAESFSLTFTGSVDDVVALTATEQSAGPVYGATSEVSAVRTVTDASTATVNSTGDDADADPGDGACDTGATVTAGVAECTLRAAIAEANASVAMDTIGFAIPTSDGGWDAPSSTFTIGVTGTQLPTISAAVTIDGTTQSQHTTAGRPVIQLDGSALVGAEDGLVVGANGVTIAALAVGGFPGDGISSSGNAMVLTGSRIGIEAAGAAALANGADGVRITGGTGVTIGGTAAGDRNVISGNAQHGIRLEAGSGHVVAGNTIGLNSAGSTAVPNGSDGILAEAVSLTTIGGTAAGAGNLVSGNGHDGIALTGASNTGNVVQGNTIGVDLLGAAARPNGSSGITVSGGASANTIGGPSGAARNLVSGNTGHGVVVTGAGSDGNVIQGNWVGLDATGTSAIGNDDGIHVGNGAASTTIGGTVSGAGNVVAGNLGHGIAVTGATTGTTVVQGNLLGLDASGAAPVANTGSGVDITGTPGVQVGGTTAAARNVIGANEYGVTVSGATAIGAVIEGNWIGTDASGTPGLGNFHGVYASGGAAGTVIGGTASGSGNRIAGVLGDGIAVAADAGGGTVVLGNSITGNDALGIDIDDDGVTANDSPDADGIPNHPLVSSVQRVSGQLEIAFELEAPAGDYRVEVFGNTGADSSGFGEGETFLGGTTVSHTGSGVEAFTVAVTSGATIVSLTATEDTGSGWGATSEFSPAVASPDLVVVNSTGDDADASTGDGQCDTGGTITGGDPECTLRAAIEEANDPATPVDTIWFAIPATDGGWTSGTPGYWTITPTASALPALTAPAVIDARTQPGFVDAPLVAIDGSSRAAFATEDGLFVDASLSAVRGLAVTNWPDDGMHTRRDGVVIAANWFGVDPAGAPAANGQSDVVLWGSATGVVIGGATAADGNVVAAGGSADGVVVGNTASSTTIRHNTFGLAADGSTALGALREAVTVQESATGTLIADNLFGSLPNAAIVTDGDATGTTITGNTFGTDATGTVARPVDMAVYANSTGTVTFGGTGAGEANTVRNAVSGGVAVVGSGDVSVLSNSFAANGGLAIDLGLDGVTANDVGDADSGPNGLLNFPVLGSASVSAGVTAVDYTLDAPTGTYRIEFFANPSGADPSGYGEGETFVGTATLVHGGGSAPYTVALGGLAAGAVVTATATDASSGFAATSEFSNAVTAVDAASVRVDDSSIRRSDMVPAGGLDPDATVAGVAGPALSVGGGAQRLVGPGLDVTSGSLTMAGWVNLSTMGTDPRVVARTDAEGDTLQELLVDSATGEAVARVRVGVATHEVRGGSVGTAAWHQLAATWDGTVLRLYVDGAQVDSTPAAGVLATDPSTPVTIGNIAAANRGVNGSLDAVTVTHDVWSADRVATQYANLASPSAFVTVGAEQTGTPGSWTVAAGQGRSGGYALAAPEVTSAGLAAWITATGLDEPGVEFSSWWRVSTLTGVDVAAGTRTGSAPTDQYETALSAAGWDVGRWLAGARTQDATPAGSPSTGTWVQVTVRTDQLGFTRVWIDGIEVQTATAQGGSLDAGSVGLRVGALPVGETWFVDDARARRIVVPEPTATLAPLDRQ